MRSKHSIKFRVTLWYVSFLVLIVLILFGALGYMSHKMIQNDIQTDLTSTVEYSMRDVEIVDGELHIDDDIVYTQNNVSLLVYTENNFIVTGTLPDGIKENIPFIDGQLRTIEDSGSKFYVYDKLINDASYDDVWVRGIISANVADADPVVSFMTKAFLIVLPLLILLASIGGYIITRRAFKPVGQIAETASGIEAGGDLSKRIGLKADNHTKDEIYQLSSTFDNMLDRLEQSFEAEKQFSNDASHELRTPLSVIMAQCEYALNEASTIEEARESMEVIYGQSHQMSALINKLLMIARADRGTLKLNIEEINVSELTSIAIQAHEDTAAERGINIHADIQPDIIAQVDESMFIRIWNNLISNSIKYGKDNGYIKIKLSVDDKIMAGSLCDNGIGISKENLPKIWNRFYQADPSRSDNTGAGLGLSMVKWIVEAHGGTIDAMSTLGEGTEIKFTIPVIQDIS